MPICLAGTVDELIFRQVLLAVRQGAHLTTIVVLHVPCDATAGVSNAVE